MHACSVGQSEKALLARVHTLEREKAMLAEQVQSAQAMLRSYMETEHYRPSITRDSSINSEPAQVHVMSACKYIYITGKHSLYLRTLHSRYQVLPV